MTLAEKQKAIEKNMKLLNLTYDEAKQVVEDDELIDKGGRCEWEPSVEEERAMRKATKLKVERKKTERKKPVKVADDDKIAIIQALNEVISANYTDVVVENAEKTISFSLNGANYSINLTKHRK